jgi:hypothetical protein
MQKRLIHAGAALLLAVSAGACGGRTSQVNNDRRAQGGGNRGVNERVALRGCVQPAVDASGYALRHIVVLPSAEQPAGQESIEHPLIARGSAVKLEAGEGLTDDLKSYMNNEVAITGDIVEDAVGTSGHDTSSSQAPAPRIAVERVKKIADNCAGE